MHVTLNVLLRHLAEEIGVRLSQRWLRCNNHIEGTRSSGDRWLVRRTRGEQQKADCSGRFHDLYRTSITFRTTSFAAPGRFCTLVNTSLKACDSPPCLKHSPQRGRFVKSRRSNPPCISAIRGLSRVS